MIDLKEKLKSIDKNKFRQEVLGITGEKESPSLGKTLLDIRNFVSGFRSTRSAIEAPGYYMNKGISQMGKSPVAGMLNVAQGIAHVPLLMATAPLGILDDIMRGTGQGRTADLINEVFALPSKGAQKGTEYIEKGLDVLGIDKETRDEIDRQLVNTARQSMGLPSSSDPDEAKEISEALGEINQLSATLLALKKGGELYKYTKEKVFGIPKDIKSPIYKEPYKPEAVESLSETNIPELLVQKENISKEINYLRQRMKGERAEDRKFVRAEIDKNIQALKEINQQLRGTKTEAKFEIKSSKTKPTEGVTQEKLPTELAGIKLPKEVTELPPLITESALESVGIKKTKNNRYIIPGQKGFFRREEAERFFKEGEYDGQKTQEIIPKEEKRFLEKPEFVEPVLLKKPIEPKVETKPEKTISSEDRFKNVSDDIKETVGFLEKELPTKAPPPKERLTIEGYEGTVDILPIKKQTKPAKDKYEPFGNIVSKDNTRPAITGIFEDASNKTRVAANGFILLALEDKGIKSNRLFNPKTLENINEKYPAYQSIIPTDNPYKIKTKTSELLDNTTGVVRANKFLAQEMIQAEVKYGDKSIFFNPEYLEKILRGLESVGIKDIILELPERNTTATIIRDAKNPKNFALIMPVKKGGGYKTVYSSSDLIKPGIGKPEKIIKPEVTEREKSFEKSNLIEQKPKVPDFNIPKGANAARIEFESGKKSNVLTKDIDVLQGIKDPIKSITYGKIETSKEGKLKWDTFREIKQRIISEEQYKKDIDDLTKGQKLTTFPDPTQLPQVLRISAYHFENIIKSGIEKGRQVIEFTKKLVNDLGLGIAKFAKNLFNRMESESKTDFKNVLEYRTPSEKDYQDYIELYKKEKNVVNRVVKATKEMGKIRETGREKLKPIDTRLYEISPQLWRQAKRGQYESNKRTAQETEMAKQLLIKSSKMTDEDFATIDLALNNYDFIKARQVLEKNNATREFDNIIKIMDKLALDTKTEKIPNYYARIVKDHRGLMESFKGSEIWSELNQIIESRERISGKMSIEEMADFANKAVRGYVPGIKLTNKHALERVLRNIDKNQMQFYERWDTATMKYIEDMNETLYAHQLLGKVDIKELGYKSVGRIMAEQILSKEKRYSQEELRELTKILNARFEGKPMSGWVSTLRDVGHLTKIANFLGALRQLADLYVPFYRTPKYAVQSILKSGGGKIPGIRKYIQPKLKIKDIFYDPERIAWELANPRYRSKILRKSFKGSLFTDIDITGKESLINALYYKYHNLSKRGKLTTTHPDYWRFEKTFGKEADNVIREYAGDKITDNILYHLYNEVAGVQAIDKWSLPEGYLKGGNMAIAYQFKTFAIRRLDYILNDTIRMARDKNLNYKSRKQAVKNLMYLLSTLALAEGGTDVAIKTIKGEEINLSDLAFDNLLRIVLFSKYDVSTIRKEGLAKGLFKKIMPPLGFIDDPFFDIIGLFQEKDKPLRTVRNLPIMGEIIYARMKNSIKKTKLKRTSRSSR